MLMNKGLCLLLALTLAAVCCAASLAEDAEEIPGTVEYPWLGFRFVPPEVYRNTKGIVSMSEPYDLSEIIRGVNCAYYAMPEEKYNLMMSSHGQQLVPPEEIMSDSLFTVFSLGRGMTFSRFNTLSGSIYDDQRAHELASFSDTTVYLYMEGLNQDFIDDVDPVYLDEYIAMASAEEEVAAAFTFFEPDEKPDPFAGMVGSRFEFTATDMDGNQVSSADVFGQNDVTLLNVWTSWCGPCIGELEDLQAIHRNLGKKGVGVLGMLADDDLDTARDLLAEFNVTYPVILAPDNLYDFFPLDGYPSSLFVGRDGTVLAEPVVGASVARYHTILNQLLGQ